MYITNRSEEKKIERRTNGWNVKKNKKTKNSETTSQKPFYLGIIKLYIVYGRVK